MIPDQKILLNICTLGKEHKQHYHDLGYLDSFKSKQIEVDIKDLPQMSNKYIKVICDYCGDDFLTKYSNYNINKNKTIIKKDCCKKCQPLKSKDVCLVKYGVENITQTDDYKANRVAHNLKKYGVKNVSQSEIIKDKKKNTYMKHYGVPHYSMTDEYKEKCKSTLLENYGVEYLAHSEDIDKKRKNACLSKYGCENVLQSEEIKSKIKKTNREKYGYDYVLSSPIIRQKIRKTLYENGNTPTSSQQLKVFEMIKEFGYNPKLNYPEEQFNLDIALFVCDKKIDIEYDGWYWHQDRHKDAIRNGILVNNGWNIIRIKSGNLLPAKEQLLDAINEVINNDIKVFSIKLDDWK